MQMETTVYHLLLLWGIVFMSIGSCNGKDQTPLLPDDHEDRMDGLPGWNKPLPTKWYSGYLVYELEGRTVNTHYIFIEAEIEGGVTADTPLIYWSNGGPGASSLFGLLTELGPFNLSDESLETEDYKSTKIPTPILNSKSWNKLGHLLIFDAPAPVGFSYCNDSWDVDPDTHSCGGLSWTDELASLNTFTALQTFYANKFPSMKKNPLFLTGESYAGVYIPMLASRVVDFNRQAQAQDDDYQIPLQGWAVGDGCLGTETGICGNFKENSFIDYWYVLFLAGHHQIPLETFHEVIKACNGSPERGLELYQPSSSKIPKACKNSINKMKQQMGGVFDYSLYDDCTYSQGMLKSGGALNDYPCGGGPVMDYYLSLDVVKEAMHTKSNFVNVDNAQTFDYTATIKDLRPFYKEMQEEGKLRMLVYNGDTDPAITSFAAYNWTSNMGFPVVEDWSPWTIDGCRRMGGYVKRYEGNFEFLTIRGSGHMVPTFKPDAAFVFLKSWIEGVDYPPYDAGCQSPAATTMLS